MIGSELRRTLERTGEEFGDLSLLVAFQFVRTKGMRLLPERLDAQIRKHVRSMGIDTDRIHGLFDLDAEGLKREHIRHQVQNIEKYAEIIAEKEFFLMTAPDGHSFYIGDHPVVLHNDEFENRAYGPSRNWGSVHPNLLAALIGCAAGAYDKAVLGQMMKAADEAREKEVAGYALSKLMAGEISAAQMKEAVDTARDLDPVAAMIKAIRSGHPIAVGPEQVPVLQFVAGILCAQVCDRSR